MVRLAGRQVVAEALEVVLDLFEALRVLRHALLNGAAKGLQADALRAVLQERNLTCGVKLSEADLALGVRGGGCWHGGLGGGGNPLGNRQAGPKETLAESR